MLDMIKLKLEKYAMCLRYNNPFIEKSLYDNVSYRLFGLLKKSAVGGTNWQCVSLVFLALICYT